MKDRNFRQLLDEKLSHGKSVCVGLDPVVEKLPEPLKLRYTEYSSTTPKTQFIAFCEPIVHATIDLVCAYKLNLGSFIKHGVQGLEALQRIIETIHDVAPDVPVILDAKYGDVSVTNSNYADFAFNRLKADAVTVNPFLGGESLEPFLARAGKGIFVLCHTSNPGACEFQDMYVVILNQNELSFFSGYDLEPILDKDFDHIPFYRHVAYQVAKVWNRNRNCALVVGATYPKELREVRDIVGDMPILIPGIGAQGGDVEKAVRAGKDSRGRGMIFSSTRDIIFASSGDDFAEAARRETKKTCRAD